MEAKSIYGHFSVEQLQIMLKQLEFDKATDKHQGVSEWYDQNIQWVNELLNERTAKRTAFENGVFFGYKASLYAFQFVKTDGLFDEVRDENNQFQGFVTGVDYEGFELSNTVLSEMHAITFHFKDCHFENEPEAAQE